eukprot:CAMPEP_0184861498 /NCGR_PEP_ID=MMETSP0580-20130426/6172_1 /TAXON_ID=1118495 /ORGANISM="Dactyliosolen fragilissimus" /LENGTH=875 /DNA_ID=CAMNT_0027359019 /DNA_START=64 /DNA_END=2691 /DNA_ORIENTATION=+
MSSSSFEDSLSSAVASTLAPFLDEDICEYIQSTLAEDPHDEDARENVKELLRGSIDMDDIQCNNNNAGDPESIISDFFQKLQIIPSSSQEGTSGSSGGSGKAGLEKNQGDQPLQKLKNAVTIKEHDIQTFASGLSSTDVIGGRDPNNEEEQKQPTSSIRDFYDNMIDISSNEAAISERKRRKERQKTMRLEMEEAERKRAIQEAMDLYTEDNNHNNENSNNHPDRLLDAAADNSADVHIRNMDLPNLRGGGPDLLQNASITIARGRRYGLMGRNGCGKTTFLTYLAQRQMAGAVPKKMTMLLVRQEIVGNDMSAVETVLKSDVKREGVKKFIKYCEDEIERLTNGGLEDEEKKEESKTDETDADSNADTGKKVKGSSKGRQKLAEKKKSRMERAAREKAKINKTAIKIKQENIEARKDKLTEKLGVAYQKLAEIEQEEGGDPEPRARKVLNGMGFSEEMQNKPTSQLSGGWRMRVSISCALFASPSLLLLDEPTNHLDVESCMWLTSYLNKEFKGSLVVVSHDRYFLNSVVTDVVHFHKNSLFTYKGDITNFEAVRDDEKQRQIRLRENQEAKKAHLQKYIDLHSQAGENGVKAAKQRKSKMKKLEKVGMMSQEGKRWKASYDGDAEEVEEYEEEEKVELIFPDCGSFDGDIVRIDEATFGYTQDNLLLKKVDLTVNLKSRIALLGRNGCGKSTMIKLIIGAMQPLSGNIKTDGRAKIEYLAQHQLEQLDPDGTPLQTMIERYPGDRSNSHILLLRRHLANFGLGGEILPKQRIHTMSGGQKCRLCLAAAMYRKPHLLILDEPSNHLDWETLEALVEAIKNFEGGVLLVSHDQHLLTSVCKELYVVDKGDLQLLPGVDTNDAFKQYKRDVLSGRR